MATLLCGGLFLATSAAARDWTLRISTEGREVEGDAIHWDAERFFILGRDGYLWEFGIDKARQSERLPKRFRSYSQSELRDQLLREFDRGYDVAGTGHYLVVHPRGQRDKWAPRFEQLYREMSHYFFTRGIEVREPQFPLVAVVFRHRAEFEAYARANDVQVSSALLGFYHPLSNRILLYDVTADENSGLDWRVNAATVVHEAAHQTAFNTGIHSRFAYPPRWVCEGLGTLFEARGVYDARRYGQLHDRINQDQRGTYRRYFPDDLPGQTVAALVASDQLFRISPTRAYALSWALTFMLAETQPRQLGAYLHATANKQPFRPVSAAERVADFQSVFGKDLPLIESRLARYMQELP